MYQKLNPEKIHNTLQDEDVLTLMTSIAQSVKQNVDKRSDVKTGDVMEFAFIIAGHLQTKQSLSVKLLVQYKALIVFTEEGKLIAAPVRITNIAIYDDVTHIPNEVLDNINELKHLAQQEKGNLDPNQA